jgi:hypothetical protein
VIEFVKLGIEEILPSMEDILRGQGIPKGFFIKDNIKILVEKSLDLFIAEAAPSCIIQEISKDDFHEIFIGEGNNEEGVPLEKIYLQADHLILFAITMGDMVSHRIAELFGNNDFALASMLDTTASCSTDKSIDFLEKRITEELIEKKLMTKNSMVLSYSPGFCGWHINAQKKLFLYLHPELIGISLNESCLMTPLKSVTGVLISGDKNIHYFGNSFSFCYNCKVQSCIERQERILNH